MIEQIESLLMEAQQTWEAASPSEIGYERYWFGRLVALREVIGTIAANLTATGAASSTLQI